jgi:putative ABC transport system permease protein
MSAGVWPAGRTVTMCRVLLSFASRSVPLLGRADWLAEWEGELWALARRGESRLALVRFALAGLSEARWEKRMEEGTMNGIAQDIRLALRGFGRTPGFALVVIAVLTLGIGANTALFSALKATLPSSSPYPGADRLVMVDLLFEKTDGAPADTAPWSYPKFEVAKQGLGLVTPLAGYASQTGTLTGVGGAARIGVEYVTPAYLELLGVRPVVGRAFDATEEVPNPALVVILSHTLWQSRWGGDPGVIGETLRLNGTPLEIVGVLPSGFRGASGAADLWVPMAATSTIQGAWRLRRPFAHWFQAIGRLAPGSGLADAQAQAKQAGAAVDAAYPDPSGKGEVGPQGVAVVPFLRARVNPLARAAVTAVSIGAVLLLLIACANVASLLLARATARGSDQAVRAALGAGRGRLVRESLVESMLLSITGGVLGIAFAAASQRLVSTAVRNALETAGTRGLQYIDPATLGMDGSVLVAGVGFALLTGLLAGLWPARLASKPDLTHDLRAATGSVGRRREWPSGRGLLVAGQLALTLVLLAGAGLMAASLGGLRRIDAGFSNTGVLSLRFERGRSATAEENRVFEEQLVQTASRLPGVVSVSTGVCAPLTGRCEVAGVRQVDDRTTAEPGGGVLAYDVSQDYFATLGVRLVEGRTFDGTDRTDAPPVAVINETAARTLFGTSPAIDHRIAITRSLTDGRMARVIGVVADVRYAGLETAAMPAVYFSRSQSMQGYGTLFVRTAGDPYGLVDAVRGVTMSLDPELPLYDVVSLADLRARQEARTRVLLALLAGFAGTGLLLSAIGLYGIVAWSVSRRRKEMGLRLVLGAPGRDIIAIVMKRPLLLAGTGIASGVVAALGLTRLVRGLLFEVSPSDPRVLGVAAGILLAIAAIAAWIPARRVNRIDPATALRSD